MPRKSTPAKWNDYTCFKQVVGGTRIIPFKTPLKNRWTPSDVISNLPDLGLVINLCFAENPYYCVDDFRRNGVDYVWIRCAGQQVPDYSVIQKFTSSVENFLSNEQNHNKLIGVHCTHGVNRTGYVVCRYLIDHLKMDPAVAIREFGSARGHEIDRDEYVSALMC